MRQRYNRQKLYYQSATQSFKRSLQEAVVAELEAVPPTLLSIANRAQVVASIAYSQGVIKELVAEALSNYLASPLYLSRAPGAGS